MRFSTMLLISTWIERFSAFSWLQVSPKLLPGLDLTDGGADFVLHLVGDCASLRATSHLDSLQYASPLLGHGACKSLPESRKAPTPGFGARCADFLL